MQRPSMLADFVSLAVFEIPVVSLEFGTHYINVPGGVRQNSLKRYLALLILTIENQLKVCPAMLIRQPEVVCFEKWSLKHKIKEYPAIY